MIQKRLGMVNKVETSYWSSQKIRVVGAGRRGPIDVELNKPYALIGTHEKADVVLRGRRIARRHLYVHATGNGIYCVDLAKGRSLNRHVGGWVRPDHPIKVGRYQLIFDFVNDDLWPVDDNPNLLAGGSGGEPFPQIFCRSKESQLGQHSITRRLSIIGRGSASTFRFTTRSLSPEHCVLYRQSDDLWIVDLKTASKTLVDGQAVECAKLEPDSQVQVGRVLFSLRAPIAQVIDEMVADDRDPFLPQTIDDSSDSGLEYRDVHDSNGQVEVAQTDSVEDHGISDSALAEPENQSVMDVEPADKTSPIDSQITTVTGDSDQDLISDETDDGEEHSAQLDQALSAIEAQSNQLAEDRKRWEQEKAEFEQQLIERKQTIDELSSQLESANKELEEQSAAIGSDRARIQEEMQALEVARQQFEESQKTSLLRLDDRETQLQQWEGTLENLAQSLRDREAEVQCKQDALEAAQQAEVKNSHARAEGLNEDQRQQVEQFRREISDEQAKIDRLAAELDSDRAKFEQERTTWLDERKQNEAELSRTLDELADEKRKLETDRSKLKQDQDQWQRSIETSTKQESDKLARQREQIEEERAKLEIERSELRENHNQDEQRLLDKQQELACIQQEMDSAQAALENDQSDWIEKQNQLEQELTKKRDELAFLQQKIDAAQVSLEDNRAEHRQKLNQLEQELVDKRQELAQVQQQLDSSQAVLANDQSDWVEKQSQLEEELTKKRDELERLQQKIDAAQANQEDDHAEWQEKHNREEQELLEQWDELKRQQQELEAANEKLQADREEFDRYLMVDETQRRVMANLRQMQREKASRKGLFSRLFRPFRRSK